MTFLNSSLQFLLLSDRPRQLARNLHDLHCELHRFTQSLKFRICTARQTSAYKGPPIVACLTPASLVAPFNPVFLLSPSSFGSHAHQKIKEKVTSTIIGTRWHNVFANILQKVIWRSWTLVPIFISGRGVKLRTKPT
jgi:hypothetical protein